jgi:phosphomannomutase/phosphoglucomutase
MNPLIFREYDIRGLAEQDLSDPVVEAIGRGFAAYLRPRGRRRIGLGRDVRLSSPRIQEAFVRGLLQGGLEAVDLGMVPTPAVYFAVHHSSLDGGVVVTGSHNPIEYNGLKLSEGTASLYGPELQEIRRLAEAERPAEETGTRSSAAILGEYADALAERLRPARGLRVVVDAGNGTAGPVAPALYRRLGHTVEELFCEPDGRFPNHIPDPTLASTLKRLQERVLASRADLGIAFDGDADRVGAVDDRGRVLYGDQLLALYARDLLRRHPGATILTEVKSSRALVEDIEAHGGVPIMWKTGHSLIKKKMRETGALLAGEMSGHVFFAEGYYGYDDAVFAGGRLLAVVSEQPDPLSSLVDSLPRYVATPEMRVDCPDDRKFAVVDKVKQSFEGAGRIIDVDGVRVDFGDGWGLLRASNTQPVLVLRFEARTADRVREIEAMFAERLQRFPEVHWKP